jgi:hypothetical protein
MNELIRTQWWSHARLFQRLNDDAKQKVVHSRNKRHKLARLAMVHPAIGRWLDELYAPLRVNVFVAYAPDLADLPRSVGQQLRYQAVRQFWDERRKWPLAHELRVLAVRTRTAAADPQPQPTAAAPESAVHAVGSDLLAEGFAVACEGQDPELAAVLRKYARERREGVPACAPPVPAGNATGSPSAVTPDARNVSPQQPRDVPSQAAEPELALLSEAFGADHPNLQELTAILRAALGG